MFEWFGWISSIFLIVCGMPQAWKSVHDGNSDGLTWGFSFDMVSW